MDNPSALTDNNATFASPPTSPPPHLRQRSMDPAMADRMRVKRSSSRVTDGAMSKYSADDDSAKTAVKVGMCLCFGLWLLRSPD